MIDASPKGLAVSASCFATLICACGGDAGVAVKEASLAGGATSVGGTVAVGGTAGSTGGGTTSGGTASGGTSPVITTAGGSAGVGGTEVVDPETSCGKGMASASLKPISLVVMFDRSSSMNECSDGSTGGGMGGGACTAGTRWELASSALTQFFQSADAADLGVALRFFPHDLPVAGCTGGMMGMGMMGMGSAGGCSVEACAQMLVDMGTLTAESAPTDAQEAALVSAVMTSAPSESQGTPISAALDGALTWATAYQAANTDQRTVVVLVTDGEPNGCSTNWADINQIAANALATSGVATYAVGLTTVSGGGLSQGDMNGLAVAGGTEHAFFVADSPTAAADLLRTLNDIRGSALACDFPLPASTTDGMAVDPMLINVNYTPSASEPVLLGLVGSAAECGTEQAWYYDDPVNPTRLVLCPAACETVTADPGAQIEILAGCMPRIVDPK